jgi:hypothetical protein
VREGSRGGGDGEGGGGDGGGGGGETRSTHEKFVEEMTRCVPPDGPVYWKLTPARELAHVAEIEGAGANAISVAGEQVAVEPDANTYAARVMLYATKNALP